MSDLREEIEDHVTNAACTGWCDSTMSPNDLVIREATDAILSLIGWRDIESAPKDGTPFLLYAQWAWEDYHTGDEPYEWRVASWNEDELFEPACNFRTVSSNPYNDYPANPRCWQPIPPAPEQSHD